MGNLGQYQDLTTLAKSLGGVENLIQSIEKGAVSKAAPRQISTGVILGGVLYVGGKGALKGGKVLLGKYRERQTAATEAKDQLRAESKEALND